MGHKLHLVYGDAILQNERITKVNETVFSTLSEHYHSQATLKFEQL